MEPGSHVPSGSVLSSNIRSIHMQGGYAMPPTCLPPDHEPPDKSHHIQYNLHPLLVFKVHQLVLQPSTYLPNKIAPYQYHHVPQQSVQQPQSQYFVSQTAPVSNAPQSLN